MFECPNLIGWRQVLMVCVETIDPAFAELPALIFRTSIPQMGMCINDEDFATIIGTIHTSLLSAMT
jgi:hypothetical protein